MMKYLISAMVIVIGWVFLSGFGISGGTTLPMEEGATAPTDTTITWINSGNGCVYRYHSWAGVWLDQGRWIRFSKNSANYAGPMTFGHAIASDTTSTSGAYDGFAFADSIYISTAVFSNDGAVTPNCTVQLFECDASPSDILTNTWTAAWETNTKLAIFGKATTYACYILTGSQNPTRPLVEILVHRFARKT